MESRHKTTILCVMLVGIFFLSGIAIIGSFVIYDTQTMIDAGCSYRFNGDNRTMEWECPENLRCK